MRSHQLSHYEEDLHFCCVVDYIYTVGLDVTYSVFRILLFDYVGDGTRSSDNKNVVYLRYILKYEPCDIHKLLVDSIN
jgi:hypothetical protein